VRVGERGVDLHRCVEIGPCPSEVVGLEVEPAAVGERADIRRLVFERLRVRGDGLLEFVVAHQLIGARDALGERMYRLLLLAVVLSLVGAADVGRASSKEFNFEIVLQHCTEGYRISTASSAAIARAKLESLSFDLLILGSGSTAFAAALTAQELSKTAAMTDERPIGGTCVNRGCLPSTNLIEAGKILRSSSNPRYPGLTPCAICLNFAALVAQKAELATSIGGRSTRA